MPSLSCDKWYQRQKAVVCPSNTRLPCSGSLCLPLKQQKFHNLRRFIFSRFLFYLRSLTTKFHWSCGGGDFLLYSKTDKKKLPKNVHQTHVARQSRLWPVLLGFEGPACISRIALCLDVPGSMRRGWDCILGKIHKGTSF